VIASINVARRLFPHAFLYLSTVAGGVTGFSTFAHGAASAPPTDSATKSDHAAEAKTTARTQSEPTQTQNAVAVVNGNAIGRGVFDYYVKTVSGKSPSELTVDQLNQLLDNLIRGELCAEAAVKARLDKQEDTASTLSLERMQVLQQAYVNNYLADKQPSEDDLLTEYQMQVANAPKMQYHARHILLATQVEAQKIIDELKGGAGFEFLAKQNSSDASKDKGGDLGWFTLGSMVKPFADAVASLNNGQTTSLPVQTQYGWHVIQLIETRATPIPSFDEARGRVAEIVKQKKAATQWETLMKNATVVRKINFTAIASTRHASAVPTEGNSQPGQGLRPQQDAATSPAAIVSTPNVSDYYPDTSRRNGEEGTASVRICLDATGAVLSAELHTSSGFAALDQAALSIANATRFTPATTGGQAVGSCVLLPVNFSTGGQPYR
jgi:peptidyl-prolyl cis-trans isomerase C